MKKFAPQLWTCGFEDYLSQTPSTVIWKLFLMINRPLYC